VDPGRVDLIHAVRLHQTEQALGILESCLAPILPIDDNTNTGKTSRRRAKHRFLNKEHKSVFKLTNKQWRHDSGQLLHVKKTKKLHKDLALQTSMNILATATSRTTSLEAYFQHVTARIQTARAFIQLMQNKRTSRWKFEAYMREQRAVEKVAIALLAGMDPTSTLVVWGDGGFSSSAKGHPPASNKRLRHLLSRHMPIVMGTEYCTIKLSCCCHAEMTQLVKKNYKKRATVLRCDAQHKSVDGTTTSKCGDILGRDENAAHNILYIFQEQYKDDGGAVPRDFRPKGRL
jgi:hypothetical protein